jgi:DNA-binding SARP family transcriptional activator
VAAHSHRSSRTPGRSPTGRGRSVVTVALRLIRALVALVILLVLIAGLPWALVHFVGWPLPDHVPTWDEVQVTLLNPMSSRVLLNILAVACWIVWFVFVLDVARCAVDAVHGTSWSQVLPAGSRHGMATALIGTIVLALLGNRASQATAVRPVALAGEPAPTAVVAPRIPGPPASAAVRPVAATSPMATIVIDPAAPAPPGLVKATEEVRSPHDGIHDSLWRIAERIFGPGGGRRWPELFQLNRGVPQQDGQALTVPTLVRPGWTITAYIPSPPADERPSDTQPPQVPSPAPPPSPAPSTLPVAPSTQAPAEAPIVANDDADQAGPGLDLSTGVFVSLGLAAAITAAMVSARMWRRRRYRIGSGDRADLQRPTAPVVRALRAAHDHDQDEGAAAEGMEYVDLTPAPPPARATATAAGEIGDRPTHVPARLGVRSGRELALNLAGARGVGLAGPGAAAAARALLLHLLTEPPAGDIGVIIPADDLHCLLRDPDIENLPSAVQIAETLDDAITEMEAALLTRTRGRAEENDRPATPPSLVLLASPDRRVEGRLQAVLDTGSTLGLAGILLGQWRPGATVLVRVDGTIGATSPGPGEALALTRLFTLPAADATALLAALRDAECAAGAIDGDQVRMDGAPTTPSRDDAKGPVVHAGAVPDQRPAEKILQLESSPLAARNARPPVRDTSDQAASSSRPADGQSRGRASAPEPPPAPLQLKVLGRVQFSTNTEPPVPLLHSLAPRQREILIFLACHPDGCRRDTLAAALWPNAPGDRPYNSFHATMSQMRRALRVATGGVIGDVVVTEDGRYSLGRSMVTVDLWDVQTFLNDVKSASSANAQRNSLLHATEMYGGDLAEDLSAEWIEAPREAIRRSILDAYSRLVRALGPDDLDQALDLLERARELDPFNEAIYRDIMRAQARLRRFDGIPRTMAIMSRSLQTIGEHPGRVTTELAEALGQGRPPGQ